MQTQHVRSLQSSNDTKFCLTFSLITPLFSSLSMNLHGILTRRFFSSWWRAGNIVLCQSTRSHNVTIKTNREKPRWGLTSLASTLLVPGRPSGPPYLHSVYYRFCSDSFLSISLLLVSGYYTISLLFPINSHLSIRVKILFQSSLLNHRCWIIATSYLLPLGAILK